MGFYAGKDFIHPVWASRSQGVRHITRITGTVPYNHLTESWIKRTHMIHSIPYSSLNLYGGSASTPYGSSNAPINQAQNQATPVQQRSGSQQTTPQAPPAQQNPGNPQQASLSAAALTSAEVALLMPYIQNGLISPDILAPSSKSGPDLTMLSGQWADEDRMAMGALNASLYKNYFTAQRYDSHYTNTKRGDWVLGNTAKKNSLNAYRSDVVWDADTGSFTSTPRRAVDDLDKHGVHKRNAQTGGTQRETTPKAGTKTPKATKNALVHEESFRYGDSFELRAKSNNSNTKGLKRRVANWAYDNDNMHTAEFGKTGSVTASLEKHGKNLVELQKARELDAPLKAKKAAKAAKVAESAESYRDFSNVRTRMAGAEMRHLQNTVQRMEAQLAHLSDGAKKTRLQGELKLAQERLKHQQAHFAKLNHHNTRTQ
jgi:hypothetical protein